MVSDEEAKRILGDEKKFYESMGKAFCVAPIDESIKAKDTIKFEEHTWNTKAKRDKIKNVWIVIKDILKKISECKTLTNNADGTYDRITLSQITMLASLIGMRKRGETKNYKFDEKNMKLFHVDTSVFSLCLEITAFKRSIQNLFDDYL